MYKPHYVQGTRRSNEYLQGLHTNPTIGPLVLVALVLGPSTKEPCTTPVPVLLQPAGFTNITGELHKDK
jgi:hypothetical protein